MFLYSVRDPIGIGVRIEKPGVVRAAHNKEQMKAFLRVDLERFASAGGTRNAAADADAWVLVEQEHAIGRRGVEQLSRQGEDSRVLGADGQQAGSVFAVLKTVE